MRRKDRVAVVVNPNAGKNTPRAGLGKVLAQILSTPYWTYNTETLRHLEGAAQQIHKDRPDILVVVGGDGTIHQTLTSVLRQHYRVPNGPLPQILLMPTGTMNTIATSLGLTKISAKKFAEAIAEKLSANVPLDCTHRYPLKINDEYGFLYGAGLPVNFLERYYMDEKNRGPKRAVKIILSTIWDELCTTITFRKSRQLLTKPVYAKISLPSGTEPPVAPSMKHTGIMVASIDEVGLGCRAMPDACSKPGCFMLRSTQLSFWGLAASIGQLWAGLPLLSTFDTVAPRIVVEYENPTVRMVDGDIKNPAVIDTIETGPLLSFVTG